MQRGIYITLSIVSQMFLPKLRPRSSNKKTSLQPLFTPCSNLGKNFFLFQNYSSLSNSFYFDVKQAIRVSITYIQGFGSSQEDPTFPKMKKSQIGFETMQTGVDLDRFVRCQINPKGYRIDLHRYRINLALLCEDFYKFMRSWIDSDCGRIDPLSADPFGMGRIHPDVIFPGLTLRTKMVITFSRKLLFTNCLLGWKLDFKTFPKRYILSYDSMGICVSGLRK